eukprot:s1918_g5.t1
MAAATELPDLIRGGVRGEGHALFKNRKELAGQEDAALSMQSSGAPQRWGHKASISMTRQHFACQASSDIDGSPMPAAFHHTSTMSLNLDEVLRSEFRAAYDQEANTKHSDLSDVFSNESGLVEHCSQVIDSQLFMLVFLILTVYALFATDLDTLFGTVDSRYVLSIVTTVVWFVQQLFASDSLVAARSTRMMKAIRLVIRSSKATRLNRFTRMVRVSAMLPRLFQAATRKPDPQYCTGH